MPKLADLLSGLAENAQTESEQAGLYRLLDLIIRRVDVVDRPANRRPWLVVKRGEEMSHDEEFDFSGPEIDENETGNLTAVGKAESEQGASDEGAEAKPESGAAPAEAAPEGETAEGETDTAKAMSPPMKAKALSALKALTDKINAGSVTDAQVGQQLMALAESLAPEEEDMEASGKGKADKSKAKKSEGEEPDPIEAAIDGVLAKRGAKMSADNRKALKGILSELKKLLDSVEPGEAEQVEQMISAAVGKVEKRVGDQLSAFETRLVERVASALAAGGTAPTNSIPEGQSATDEGKQVAKGDRNSDDFVAGIDFNDPNQWGTTADPETSFFTNG